MRCLSLILSLAACTCGMAIPGSPIALTASKPPVSAKQVYIPKNLDDAFVELGKLMKPDEVMKLKSGTENDLIDYHFGLGMWMRNNWGLWKGSRLSRWFNDVGLFHPDDISATILKCYWRHLNGKPLEIQKQVKYYKDYWADANKGDGQYEIREKKGAKLIASKMLHLRLSADRAPAVILKPINDPTLRVRFMAPFRGGVFLAVRLGSPPNQTLNPYFLDLRTKRLSQISIKGIDRLVSSIAIGNTLYVSGTENGFAKLVCNDEWDHSREMLLPNSSEAPVVGFNGKRLVLVFGHEVFEREGSEWISRLTSKEPFPKTGLVPQLQRGFLYLRDEGYNEDNKRLWRIRMRNGDPMPPFDQQADSSGWVGLDWSTCVSYALSDDSSFWAAFGAYTRSLVHYSPDNGFQFATVRNSLRFGGQKTVADLAAVTAYGGKIYAAGRTGFFVLDGKEIRLLLVFKGAERMMCDFNGEPMGSCDWRPASLLVLSDSRFVLAGMYGGIGLFERSPSGKWTVTMLDHRIGKELRL